MGNGISEYGINENDDKKSEIVYNTEKDFYKGISGELRLKAEGLFKKAKEKGISIEDISIATLKENSVEFPGIGKTELPTFIVKVKGIHQPGGQIIVDGKQIDYYNRYQRYLADRIEKKNILRDEKKRAIRENGRVKLKGDPDFSLDEWELFEIGKSLVEDKEFGMEKAITGACDRVIRKLMGENDWIYPEEARLLDEEYSSVQENIIKDQDKVRPGITSSGRKATDRQINYLKARVKNYGLDPENEGVLKEIFKHMGIETTVVSELNTGEMSRVIDALGNVVPKVKERISREGMLPGFGSIDISQSEGGIKQ